MLNTLLPILLSVPLTVTPYRSPNPLTVRDLCDDIAISLTEAVEYKVITPHEALSIYEHCLRLQ